MRAPCVQVWGGGDGDTEEEGQRKKESQADCALRAEPILWKSHGPEVTTQAKTKSSSLNKLCHQEPQIILIFKNHFHPGIWVKGWLFNFDSCSFLDRVYE